MCELRERHREGHELAAHGIERKPHGFESVSTEKGAILFLSENHSRPANTIFVLERSAAYLSFAGLAIRQAECLSPYGIDRKAVAAQREEQVAYRQELGGSPPPSDIFLRSRSSTSPILSPSRFSLRAKP